RRNCKLRSSVLTWRGVSVSDRHCGCHLVAPTGAGSCTCRRRGRGPTVSGGWAGAVVAGTWRGAACVHEETSPSGAHTPGMPFPRFCVLPLVHSYCALVVGAYVWTQGDLDLGVPGRAKRGGRRWGGTRSARARVDRVSRWAISAVNHRRTDGVRSEG